MLLLVRGGIVAKAQVGKAVITVPMIRADLAPSVGAGASGALVLSAARIIISRTTAREPDGKKP